MEGEFGLENKPIIVKELEKTLRQVNEEKYLVKTTKNEEVLDKEIIIRDFLEYDENLLEGVLGNEILKKHFTKEVSGSTVIIVQDLIEILETEIYFRDSYTNYANKIGLTVDGNFIKESSEVVLDFPYKDSILRAGMTKDDIEDEDVCESYYHESIAGAEIDAMLDKKVLVNVKRYDSEGEHETDEFSKENNLIIKGNNLIALHTLKHKYAGEIKTIFLDPPYYFVRTKPSDAFLYNSNFKLSTWLVFMKNRLEIAHELLKDSGVLFVTISDEGAHYLKVLMDGIFGAGNFIADVTWESRSSISSDGLMSMNSNHVLVYSKNKQIIDKNSFRLALDIETFKYDDNDGRGRYRIEPFDAPEIRKNLEYPIENPNTKEVYYPPTGRHWRTTQEEYERLLREDRIRFGVSGKAKPQLKAYYSEVKDSGKGRAASSIWHDVSNNINWFETNTNTSATKHLRTIFGYDAFTNPKPEELLKRVIELSSDEGDIVLDFFMGSATTQAVAMKMNRRFIGIEQMDYISTVSVPRLRSVIEGEEGGISEEVGWEGGGSFVYAELMPKSRGYIGDIQKASSINELNSIYKRMLENVDIDFRVDLLEIEEIIDKEEISLEDLRKLLIQIIDKNQLYYNYSEIDDKNVRDLISNSDYEFNKSFYKKDGDLDD